MAQLPHNNMPFTPCNDADDSSTDDNKPLSSTVKSPMKKETSREKIARLQRELKADRKKLAKAESTVSAQSTSYETYKAKMESTVANLNATVTDINGKIQIFKFMAETATDAAKTASKLVDNTSAKVIEHNNSVIRGLQKKNDTQATKLAAAHDVLHNYQRLKHEQDTWVSEKKALLRLNTNLQKSKTAQEAILAEQTTIKFQHKLELANVALETKKVALQQTRQKQQNAEKNNNATLENKMKFTEFHFRQRDRHKDKDVERRETVKDKKTKEVQERIQVTGADMVRVNMLNGGAFPPASQMLLVSNTVHYYALTVTMH